MPWYHDVENDVRHHKKEIIMVIGTIILVVFAYLAYRRSKGGSQVPASDTSGVTDAVGNPIDQTGTSIANAIKSQTGILDQIDKRLQRLNVRNAHLNTKLRNLNKKEHKQVVQNRHIEQQLKHLSVKHPQRKATHPAQKAHPKAPSGASLVKHHRFD